MFLAPLLSANFTAGTNKLSSIYLVAILKSWPDIC